MSEGGRGESFHTPLKCREKAKRWTEGGLTSSLSSSDDFEHFSLSHCTDLWQRHCPLALTGVSEETLASYSTKEGSNSGSAVNLQLSPSSSVSPCYSELWPSTVPLYWRGGGFNQWSSTPSVTYLSSRYAGTAPLGTTSSRLFFDSRFSCIRILGGGGGGGGYKLEGKWGEREKVAG